MREPKKYLQPLLSLEFCFAGEHGRQIGTGGAFYDGESKSVAATNGVFYTRSFADLGKKSFRISRDQLYEMAVTGQIAPRGPEPASDPAFGKAGIPGLAEMVPHEEKLFTISVDRYVEALDFAKRCSAERVSFFSNGKGLNSCRMVFVADSGEELAEIYLAGVERPKLEKANGVAHKQSKPAKRGPKPKKGPAKQAERSETPASGNVVSPSRLKTWAKYAEEIRAMIREGGAAEAAVKVSRLQTQLARQPSDEASQIRSHINYEGLQAELATAS